MAIATGTAILAGAAIAGGVGLATGLIGANASRSAANIQADAATNAANTSAGVQREMFYVGRDDTAPWRTAGANALSQLVSKMQAGPGSYTQSPGYQFRLSEGNKAIQNAAAVRGNALNPATVKALGDYAQNYATNDYQNFLDRYYRELTPYQSLAGVGQTAATQTAAQGTQVGANIGNTLLQGGLVSGQAQAGGQINQANAITGGLQSGVNNYLMWKYLNPGSDGNISTGGAINPYYTAPTASSVYQTPEFAASTI
jgi:hypothetical protein